MTQEFLLICLLGGIVATDTTAAFQVLVSHPLVGCTVAGLLLRDAQLGLSVGILLELLWLAEVPVGGVRTNEGNVGALVSAAVLIMLARRMQRPEVLLCGSLLWGLGVAWAGGWLVRGCRRINTVLLHRADAFAARGDTRGVSLCHAQAIALSFVAGVVLTGFGVLAGTRVLAHVVSMVPPSADRAFALTPAVVLGAGLGAVGALLLRRKNLWALAVGLFAGLLLLR
ncbi:MAG: PTS sugar transporter subunit IIC [candidate division KSB1 bacterium]|nr:PTS sugar transporter subunit IIC [candidate division KSB1 bacterium]MDZ7385396.1 PTS sugar transporter subunit IIC [candidate division KSB1 bacterium]MDZ7394201.1 PTS sugar transporter subunit IIC [candidate division KSB1 bacterium]MDZ7413940.1 PTS sugar transporter subunit IIC [candidate division KSB1 bacterium]